MEKYVQFSCKYEDTNQLEEVDELLKNFKKDGCGHGSGRHSVFYFIPHTKENVEKIKKIKNEYNIEITSFNCDEFNLN